MFLEKVELKPFDQLREDGCEIDVIQSEGLGNDDLILIKTKDRSGRSVTFAINGNYDKPWPIYVRPVDDSFIMKRATYDGFRHLFLPNEKGVT